jgi:hypothetical protein
MIIHFISDKQIKQPSRRTKLVVGRFSFFLTSSRMDASYQWRVFFPHIYRQASVPKNLENKATGLIENTGIKN